MVEISYILGAGHTEGTAIGSKARHLDKAANQGLPVPPGIIVRDESLQIALLQGLIIQRGNEYICREPRKLIDLLNVPGFDGLVAVRSAFGAEDRQERSYAGQFETVLNVDPTNATELARAMTKVWSSAAEQSPALRREVLIMKMVDAQYAGVAFTEQAYEDDLVNYAKGVGHKLVSGDHAGEMLHLPMLWRYERPAKSLPAWQQRLQRLLRNVRGLFGKADWDVEWADDGEHCYLLQVRPVTRATRRNEAFTLANHKENLPEQPSYFMTDVVAQAAPHLFEHFRHYDGTLPENRPFIEIFYGRPYINLSLMTEMMRHLGLPTRLITANIGGVADQQQGFNVGRMLIKIGQMVLPKFALAQLGAVQRVQAMEVQVIERARNPGTTFDTQIDNLMWLYTILVTEMFSLMIATGPLTLLLRQMGTLAEHSARHRTISTRLYTDLAPLRDYVAAHPELQEDLKAGHVPSDAGFQALWNKYMERYGHRGVYESDIARPRYHEAPANLLPTLLRPQRPQHIPRRTLKGWLTLPLWWWARGPIHAREQWRHTVMQGFDAIREAMLTRAAYFVGRGILPNMAAIWQLSVHEVRHLEHGWHPEEGFFEARAAEIEQMSHYHLPDFFHRFDNLEDYHEDIPEAINDDSLHGISLTKGHVQGRAWVLKEPASTLPEGYTPETTILIAPSIDAGWIPAFDTVAGVVVETGGDLSHGSIILREMGLPAITNVQHVMHAITTGDHVQLDASMGIITRLERASVAGDVTEAAPSEEIAQNLSEALPEPLSEDFTEKTKSEP